MCVISNVGDMGSGLLPPGWPTIDPYQPYVPAKQPWTSEAFEEFMRLLQAAKKYDTKTGQADCENPDKTKVAEDIRKVAEAAGVAKEERQRAFTRELAGLRALIEGEVSVELLVAAMESIVSRFAATSAAKANLESVGWLK